MSPPQGGILESEVATTKYKDDEGSQKSNDSMTANQHIEPRNSGQVNLISPLNYLPISKDHLEEKTVNLQGHKKVNVLVSEMKKHYKLNKLKSFIDHDA